jgi:hypothetical protein
LIGLPDVPPDPVLWIEAAVLSEAPGEIRPEHPPPKLVTAITSITSVTEVIVAA